MNYDTLDEIPEWAIPSIKKLIFLGVIGYSDKFEFSLNDDILKICLILARLGAC